MLLDSMLFDTDPGHSILDDRFRADGSFGQASSTGACALIGAGTKDKNRMATRFPVGAWISCVLALTAFPEAARAQSVADFYRGKTVTILVGSDVGGGYDLTARTLAH